MTKKWDSTYMLEHYKDKEVKEIIETAGKYMGQYIIMACRFLDPDIICISGGITRYPGFFDSAKKYALENISKATANLISIILAEENEYTGCLGAIYYSLEEFKEEM